ncbi:MAG TPA: acyl-CoA thioesterase/bile acid-CoA:amino acid N-acyltransferase family protein [Steroidobacteraceae bacterium]|nr:acyl-CoA thioesterase/bile acid-CoA:amino acid N-acyltransferase family protein [Steroidobacteraceae bacterium]
MTQKISIAAEPGDALLTTPISIRVNGCHAGQRVRLSSRLVDDAGVEWTAHGDFIADAAGEVDVGSAPSEGGTFSGLDPAGLFWSMRPPSGLDRAFMIEATEKSHKLGQPALDPLKPVRIELAADADDGLRATTSVTLRRLLPGIDAAPVRDGRLRGMVFRWQDRSRSRGAIMSLTGSGGGVEMNYAPVLASLGYDVLSLAYFAHEDLPTTIASLPLEYFAEGFEWMRRELGASKMAVQGASRGGELTLLLAAYLPEYVSGAIAIVPMYASSAGWDPNGGVAGPSWTYRGTEIPYAVPLKPMSIEEMRRLGENEPFGYAATPVYRADLDRAEVREHASIPIERASGPLLMISGIDDQMWPSAWGADVAINRLRAKGFEHPYRHLALPDTGHWTPLPNTVTTFSQAVFHSLADIFLACGGTPQNTARTSWQTWEAMQRHYEQVFDS